MESDYPYPTLDKDGFEFDVIEQNDVEGYGFDLPDFPSDDERFSIQAGALVKLIFRYRNWVEKDGHTITCERMWVKLTAKTPTCLEGILDNSPHYTELVDEGSPVRFHPTHIVQIWK
jgi:Uncharacterized protein conserved in bacteria (DUF2314)